MRHWIILGLLAGIILLFLIIYYVFDPTSCIFFPKCPFFSLTRLKCPGCGSQRAIHALLNGNIVGAWHHNALLIVALPVILITGVAEALRSRFPTIYRRINSATVIWSIFTVIVAWWLLRNIFGC